jgi:hypothetical protein
MNVDRPTNITPLNAETEHLINRLFGHIARMDDEQLSWLLVMIEGMMQPDSLEEERKRKAYLKAHGDWLLRYSAWSRAYHRANKTAHKLSAETLFRRYEKATGDTRPRS